MKENSKSALKCTAAGAVGAGAGAAAYGVIGGVGLAVGGTAVGITIGPFIAIGTGVGLLGYGVFWLGKQLGASKKPADTDIRRAQ